MNIDGHVDDTLRAEKQHQSCRSKTAERVLAARRQKKPAHDDESENRNNQEASKNAELFSRDGEDKIGMGVGKDTLDRSLAWSFAKPAAGQKTIKRGVNLKCIGDAAARCARINKSKHAGAHMGHQFISKQGAR